MSLVPPPAFLLFFPWFEAPRWRESEFPDPFDWTPIGTRLEDHPSVEFFAKQFEYIKGLGIENVAWEYSYIEPGVGAPYSYPHDHAVEALHATGMRIAPHYDLELSIQAFDRANLVPEISTMGRINPDLDTIHLIEEGLRTFYGRIPPELVARDKNGDAAIFIYGYGFNDANPDPVRWSRFADVLISCTAAAVGTRDFKIYWSCTNHPFQQHLFLHYPRHFTPYNFVLDTPQSQFSHDSVTWNFGFDNLYVLQHYGSKRVVRLDPRYVEEPAWLAAVTDPALIFIYGWNEPFEGSFLFPSRIWGETKGRLAAHYLRALASDAPQPLPRVLIIVDDFSQVYGNRPGDWRLNMLREMLHYSMRLFAPQADILMAPAIDDAVLDRYEGIIDLTSEKDPRIVAAIWARWNTHRLMLLDPYNPHYASAYNDHFLKQLQHVPVNGHVSIVGTGAKVFVRDDVAVGIARAGRIVSSWADYGKRGHVPLVITDGGVTLVNSYGNSNEVMRAAFAAFYGRPMGTSILYGEDEKTQRFEQTADGRVAYKRLLRHSVNERWAMPAWAEWNKLPPETDPEHAPFLFGREAPGREASRDPR